MPHPNYVCIWTAAELIFEGISNNHFDMQATSQQKSAKTAGMFRYWRTQRCCRGSGTEESVDSWSKWGYSDLLWPLFLVFDGPRYASDEDGNCPSQAD